MSLIRRLFRWALLLTVLGLVVGGIAFGALYYSVSSKLPDVQTLRNIELQEPLYVYARDGRLMGLFGETRRYPVEIEKVPKRLKDAFIAIEDARFYEHGGVDYKGVARAIWLMATTDDKRVPGGSTITQQVARQFFLSSEYKLKRKFAEMLLARKMEQELTKDEIFELYLNKSFFGNRAYGVAAAAEFYYGKSVDQLSLDEMASIAAIPKFPSSGNPLSNPDRAKIRRDYVLTRMRELGMITPAEEQAAQAAPMHASPHERPVEVYAPFVAEMVRQEMIDRFGKDVLTKGYHVTTTIDPVLQTAADKAVRDGLGTYDRRHGWNAKALPHIDLPPSEDPAASAKRLRDHPTQGELRAALVLGVSGANAQVLLADGTVIDLGPDSSRWTGKAPGSLLKRGDVARVRRIVPEAKADPKAAGSTAAAAPAGPVTWRLEQLPRAQSALVSLDADTGALRALVGGYSFAGSKFNNAIQARRQPGSSFKPFIYAAAFERGYNPASIVLDAPVVFRMRGGKVWRPQNDGGGFAGPVRVREALVRSRNLVSVRMLDAIGVDYARKYITQFGFEEKELPPNLSISLGTPSLTPLSIARGYAAFANGGFRIDPWVVDEVKDRDGKQVFKHTPAVACRGCGTGRAGQAVTPASGVVDGFDLGPAGGTAAAPKPGAKTDGKTGGKPTEAKAAIATTLPAGAVLAPRAMDERIAYQITSMMRDVVLRGTATDARRLEREDVGGKTGSTNNHRDAWFSGTGGNLITTVWVGKSDNTSLGYREYGGKAALPIWIDYMAVALKDVPVAPNDPPPGMIKVAVTASGQLLPTESNGGITEYVKVEDLEKMETFVDYGSDEALPSEDSFDIF
ncbi:MAG: penicillin-binding protein 1A [Xanthomonadaceae bacterium]|nr:penicillin-binding protein 1A [Xanthomonadaceae bacterium]